MPSVVHVVTTGNFAGVERYVCDAARETAARGWDVTVVGGSGERMLAELGENVRWLPGATPLEGMRSLQRTARRDVCHAHMTAAEAISIAMRPFHRAPVVSTRHFAAPRGASRAGRLMAPHISRRLARQIAVSDFVARRLESRPDAVIPNGVPPSRCLWSPENRVVLLLQRLEREKDTLTALRAWHASGLVEEGWSLRVVGGGSEQAMLEAWADSNRVSGVTFTGPTAHVEDEFASAGILLASATAEPFGLVVLEAMAAGVPVVASASGGHLETVDLLADASMFAPGDVQAAAAALRSRVPEGIRVAASRAGRRLVEETFTVTRHVDALLQEYEACQLATGKSATMGKRSEPVSEELIR